MGWIHLTTPAGTVAVDPSIGNIRTLDFETDDGVLSPLHSAPWADDPDLLQNPDVPMVEARLAGDFFCAPFGASDVDGGPPHGWTANSDWQLVTQTADSLRLKLRRKAMGAEVLKTVTLAADAPILYQVHQLTGGQGQITLAHHPMIRLAGSGRFSCSAKRCVVTPQTPLEPARHRLALGQQVSDLTAVPAEDGGYVDLRDLPIADRHEDFVTLIEAQESELGWSAVVRETEDDIIFVLKDPAVLPVTMLWHSNGGRDYAPWNGQHRGVLGIEDGCAADANGHRAALSRNPVSDEGVATAVALGSTIRVAHVIGAIPRPQGWTEVGAITTSPQTLTLTEIGGQSIQLPFDSDFLKKDL